MLYSLIAPGSNAAEVFFANGTERENFLGKLSRKLGNWCLTGIQGTVIWEMPRERPVAIKKAWGNADTEFNLGEALVFLRTELKGQ